MWNTAIAKINLDAIRHNLSAVRGLCGRSQIMAMVKANGYGHGLVPTARALGAADGLAVARLREAVTLRESGIDQRLLLLATLLNTADLKVCASLNIDVIAHDDCSLHNILAQARDAPLRVWLKLDSGMHRAGFDPKSFQSADRLLREHRGIVELIHMTHFASADNAASRSKQFDCFMRSHQVNPDAPISTANSAALITCADTRQQWVRPGIMIYGVNPVSGLVDLSLRPAMTLISYVISIRHIGAGEAVGYDGRWTSTRASRIGTIGIGYGDGYPRHARNGTPLWVRGHMVPLVGSVSMDSLMVDLTDYEDILVGDEVTLWGNELPAGVVAEHSSTIPYDLLACITERVERQYL
jgi:alanine racemase